MSTPHPVFLGLNQPTPPPATNPRTTTTLLKKSCTSSPRPLLPMLTLTPLSFLLFPAPGPLSLEAMAHPRCVGWGEIGLDYHYDNSPRELQQQIFVRQLRHAVRLGKPLTIHTREAEDDTERILKQEVPIDHRVRASARSYALTSPDNGTDTHTLLHRLTRVGRAHACALPQPLHRHHRYVLTSVLAYCVPHLYAGVITYTTNLNTSAVIRDMIKSESDALATDSSLRIVLETDAPFMVPGNIYNSLPEIKGKRLPLCHTAMLPWTAEFVARVANEASSSSEWDVERVMRISRENARRLYGV